MRILSLFVLLVLAGCSSGAYCERTSRCENEPKMNVMMCQDTLKKLPCPKQQEDWLNCQYDHEVCTMDKRHDGPATIGYANSACKGQKQALETCLAAPPDGGS
jgi:hypothetical protein